MLAQVSRIERAVAEMAGWQIEDVSDFYREPAARITTSGGRYVTFSNQCSCPDWSKRGPVIGTGEIQCCKHQVALTIWRQLRNQTPVELVDPNDPFAGPDPGCIPHTGILEARRKQAEADAQLWAD